MIALSKFTEFVALPFLFMVQKADHVELLKMLPKLATYLKISKLDTLAKYCNSFSFIFSQENLTQNILLTQMAKEVNIGLEI